LKIDLYSYKLIFKKPFFFKTIEVLTKKGLLLCIDNHWGEIAPLEGFSAEGLEDAIDQILRICKGDKLFSLYP